MTLEKRKKDTRQRGSKTHGWGSMKKHRGAGNRGGRGMAGTGKRGDGKKPGIWKKEKYFGKYGFTSQKKRFTVVNISDINQRKGSLGKLSGEFFVIDLKSVKIDKLLSAGTPEEKYQITVDYASKKAVEKITQAGGKIKILSDAKPAPEPQKTTQ